MEIIDFNAEYILSTKVISRKIIMLKIVNTANKIMKFHTEIYRRDFYEMNLSNGQNAGNTDKMGIFGVTLWRLALKWL